MGAIKLHPAGQCFRVLFMLINLFFLVLGLALIGLGIYLFVTHNDFEYLTGNNIASGATVIVIAGVVTVLITLLGLIGACGLWVPLLALYAVVVLVIVILEIVGGILGFVYRNNLSDTVSDRASEAIGQFNDTSGAEDDAINFIQNEFDCCGWDNLTQWTDSPFFMSFDRLPQSCECDPSEEEDCTPSPISPQNIWNQTCSDEVLDFLRRTQVVLGVIGFAFGLIEVLGILIACGLVCCIRKAKNEYTTV